MKKRIVISCLSCLLAACSAAAPSTPTATPAPTFTLTLEPSPTATPLPPTDTPLPPTETLQPTDTPLPPTDTPLPPTDTPEPQDEVACPPGAPTTGKPVRLTIVNKSGSELYLTLKHCGDSAYYYLPVPTGDAATPVTQQFTISSGTYQRTFLSCQNQESRGLLAVDGNIKLTFSACAEADVTIACSIAAFSLLIKLDEQLLIILAIMA